MSSAKSSKWYFVVGGLTVLAIVVGVVISAIPSASAKPQSQATDNTLPRTITVVGSGSATSAPNLATVQIGVDTQAASPEEAIRLNDERMRATLDALKGAGVADQDIQTAYYSMYAEQRYTPDGGPTGEFTYRVNNSTSVKVRDLANLGSLLTTVVNAGANSISGIFFSIEDTTALEAQAREDAIAEAKARAQSLAQLSGVELGEVISVSEVITGSPQPIFDARSGQGGGGGAPIQPGQLEVQMQVQVSFAIQ